MSAAITEQALWAALAEVPDPELPQVSVVDLGVILRVELGEDARRARVLLMPTFLGCPAIEIMRGMIAERLAQLGLEAEVDVTREQLWSSDRISERGRQLLAEAGIAPPQPAGSASISLVELPRCPYCGSQETALDSLFGPTPCRAVAYCRGCRQPFEQFKVL